MTRLIAVDFPASDRLRAEVEVAWESGHAVLPLDQRMNPAIRRKLAVSLGANELVSEHGTEILESPDVELVALRDGDALVIATSGSTGAPKGVVHTHDGIAAHARMVTERLALSAADHWWLCLPTAHIGGFGVLSRAIRLGSRISFANHVDDATLTEALARGASHTSVVPTLLARHSFADWKLVLVGAARSEVLPSNAISTYGLTETCGGVVYNGTALRDVDIRLTNGSVYLRTPSMARTYRHAAMPLVDGWLDTGDVGTLNGDQRNGTLDSAILRIEGRSDDLIITGGNKVWPHIVEQRLREHPLVAEVVVRGVPDPEWGTVVCAWIVPTTKDRPPTLDALRSHVKETLAAYSAPRRISLVESIPRSALGKPLMSELIR